MDLEILAGLAGRIEWHDTIGSTNDRARELAMKGGGHGFVVGSEEQTAGRGRRGARWLSEPGCGLAFSVIVRPAWRKDRWGWLSLAAGLAVSRVLEDLGLHPEIKWPNDVLLDGRKVGGILIETAGESAVVGIGINVNEQALPAELVATSLRQVRGEETSREAVLGEVWAALMGLMLREPELIAEEVWERLAWRDCEIETTDGLQGRIRGFGENGELTVESAGRLVRIMDANGVRLAEGGA